MHVLTQTDPGDFTAKTILTLSDLLMDSTKVGMLCCNKHVLTQADLVTSLQRQSSPCLTPSWTKRSLEYCIVIYIIILTRWQEDPGDFFQSHSPCLTSSWTWRRQECHAVIHIIILTCWQACPSDFTTETLTLSDLFTDSAKARMSCCSMYNYTGRPRWLHYIDTRLVWPPHWLDKGRNVVL